MTDTHASLDYLAFSYESMFGRRCPEVRLTRARRREIGRRTVWRWARTHGIKVSVPGLVA